MPDLKMLLKDREVKKFSKKEYRPWDLSGDTKDNTPNPIDELNSEYKNISYSNEHASSSSKLDLENNSDKDINQISHRYLSDNRLGINEIANGYHIDNIIDTNKISNGYPLDSNKISNLSNKSDKNAVSAPQNFLTEDQSILGCKMPGVIDDSSMMIEQNINSLSGKQKIIFDIVIELCLTRDCLSTGPVQTASLANVAQTTTGTIKIMLTRLIQKQLIVRHPGKNAKGGYINLGITPTILDSVNNLKNSKKHSLFASDVILSNRYQKDISQEHNSNSIYINTTTNLTKRSDQIPAEWENINFDPLAHIGFSKTQIKQMIGKNDPTVVQESINHFAFGLENNVKVKKYEDPLNVLMGVLRKGQAWVETEYRSAIEIAQQKLLETKRAEFERKKTLEEDAFKLALSEWDAEISESERNKITVKANGDLTPPAAKLSKYFREHIWPGKKSEYVIF